VTAIPATLIDSAIDLNPTVGLSNRCKH